MTRNVVDGRNCSHDNRCCCRQSSSKLHKAFFLFIKRAMGCGASSSQLVSASRRGVVSEMEAALKAGVPVDSKDEWGHTALILAAKGGKTDACSLLITNKAEVDFLDKKNLTPLHYAAEGKHVDTVKVLLDAGAHADIYNELRETPLFDAAWFGELELCKILVEKGAKVDNQSKSTKRTPLIMAATMHKTEICKFLMEKGADATLKDDKGRTALMNCAGISDNTDPDVSKFDANQKACYEYLQSVTPAEAKAPEAAAEPPAVAGDPEPAKSVVAGDPAPASVVAGDPAPAVAGLMVAGDQAPAEDAGDPKPIAATPLMPLAWEDSPDLTQQFQYCKVQVSLLTWSVRASLLRACRINWHRPNGPCPNLPPRDMARHDASGWEIKHCPHCPILSLQIVRTCDLGSFLHSDTTLRSWSSLCGASSADGSVAPIESSDLVGFVILGESRTKSGPKICFQLKWILTICKRNFAGLLFWSLIWSILHIVSQGRLFIVEPLLFNAFSTFQQKDSVETVGFRANQAKKNPRMHCSTWSTKLVT